jgi:predicted O-methyltransferase YrrM
VGRRRADRDLIAREGDLVVLRDRERPSGRLLRQDDMDASYVDLADPQRLAFDYLRRMRDVVEVAGVRRVVHVGGAGCALPRALAAAHPDHRQEVIEVDPAVVELARRHLGLRRAPGLRIRVGDGRALLSRRPRGSADAVLIDAFVGARVPRHLVTQEALATFARVVAPDGLVAVNVVDVPPMLEAAAIAAGLAAVFPIVLALGARGALARRRGGNAVLVGAVRPPPLPPLRARAAADRVPGALRDRCAPGPGRHDGLRRRSGAVSGRGRAMSVDTASRGWECAGPRVSDVDRGARSRPQPAG